MMLDNPAELYNYPIRMGGISMTKQELQKIIGRNLYRIRMQQGMTREALAEKVGISATFYANLECGKKMMSMYTLRKLADVLCVSTDSILYEECPNDLLASIKMLLQDQPENVVAFVEKITRLSVVHFPEVGIATKEEGEKVPDECTV